MFVKELMVMDSHIAKALDRDGVNADTRKLTLLAVWFETVREVLRLSRPGNHLKEGEPWALRNWML